MRVGSTVVGGRSVVNFVLKPLPVWVWVVPAGSC
jgi:hypothetical protein